MDKYQKSLITLELPIVLEQLAIHASSEAAKELCRKLTPANNVNEIKLRLRYTTTAKNMMVLKGSPSFSSVIDPKNSLLRANLGGVLNTRELLDIAALLQCTRTVYNYGEGLDPQYDDLRFLFKSLNSNKYLEEKITTTIISEDEISDLASHDLHDIRRKLRIANSKIREALQKIISSPTYSKALQEPIITTRSDRYVVPVRADHKADVPGLIHDVSSSGATIFVEPLGAVKANNEIRELRAKERIEIERILAELSAECASFSASITQNFNSLVELDSIFARAKFSYALNATEPIVGNNELILKKARHPLISKDTAVPIDVQLGKEYDTLVITGPNTGGKTVSIKTMGLLSAMTLCGMHIPVADGSCVPAFSKILADIGDEQSIEQSLSTFSAHMTNIIDILGECGKDSLVLFDELGAGTDPVEGAALAISIIEHARQRGALIAATTHYSELKIYATTEKGVQNASCEFDVETLRPTYRLLVGIPGKSNAFAIAKRLGLSEDIISDAKLRVNSESATMEEVLEKLEYQRQILEKEKLEIDKKRLETEEYSKQISKLRAELSVRLEKSNLKAQREAQQILDDARRNAETVFDELDRIRKMESKNKDHIEVNEARAALRRFMNQNDNELSSKFQDNVSEEISSRPLKIGDVVQIKSMGVKATVLSISNDHTLVLKAGILTVNAREEDVLLLEDSQLETQRITQRVSTSLRNMSTPNSIDLRGMMTDEAVLTMERYLDSAVMARLQQVTIIHGKGTGALRQAVQNALKHNKQVKSYRHGNFGEGEMGVTIVELR